LPRGVDECGEGDAFRNQTSADEAANGKAFAMERLLLAPLGRRDNASARRSDSSARIDLAYVEEDMARTD